MPLFKYFILIKEERYARSARGSAPFHVLARMEEGMLISLKYLIPELSLVFLGLLSFAYLPIVSNS